MSARRIDSDELRSHVRDTGSHFFDPATMRSFGSRLMGDAWKVDVSAATDDGSILWPFAYVYVTSERDGGPYPAWNGARRYTVRVFVAFRHPDKDPKHYSRWFGDDPHFGRYVNESVGPRGTQDAFGYYSSRSAAVKYAELFARDLAMGFRGVMHAQVRDHCQRFRDVDRTTETTEHAAYEPTS